LPCIQQAIFTCEDAREYVEKCLRQTPEFSATTFKGIALEVLTFVNRNNNNILLYS